MLSPCPGDNAKTLKRSDDYRAYEKAMVDHARILVETGELEEPHISIFFWELVLCDSLACAISGQAPSFTDDDIRNFAAFVDYSTEGMLLMINALTYGLLPLTRYRCCLTSRLGQKRLKAGVVFCLQAYAAYCGSFTKNSLVAPLGGRATSI